MPRPRTTHIFISAVFLYILSAAHNVIFSQSSSPAAGSTIGSLEVALKQSVVNEVFPLLPYIFFEDNSADIPARYHRIDRDQSTEFTPESLPPSALEHYYHVLNIIGSRLRAHPKARITVTGCNTGKGMEKDNLSLSQARAATVVEYLTSVWNIAPTRITTTYRNLPAATSNIHAVTGAADNRRVEITTDTWEIIKPVVFTATPTVPLTVAATVDLQTQKIEKHHIRFILFDLDRSDISVQHRAIIREFILPSLQSTSTIFISGYIRNGNDIDIGGGPEPVLSRKRTASVKKALYTAAKHTRITTTEPVEPVFTNDLPEGRFYNRAVVITIETPGK